jgi:hypothetical protein
LERPLPRRSATAGQPEHDLAFANGDGVDLGQEEILRQERGVMAAHHGEDLPGERLDLLQDALGGINLRRERGHRHHVRLEILQGGFQITVQPQVEDPHLIPERCAIISKWSGSGKRPVKTDPSDRLG